LTTTPNYFSDNNNNNNINNLPSVLSLPASTTLS